MLNLFMSFLISLILTVIIETVLVFPLIILKKWGLSNLIDLLLINCFTNPIVVALGNIFHSYIYSGSLLVANSYFYTVLTVIEVVVVLVEGWLLKKFDVKLGKKAYLLSLYLNGLSYLCSFLFL